jgi:hypothetical protein
MVIVRRRNDRQKLSLEERSHQCKQNAVAFFFKQVGGKNKQAAGRILIEGLATKCLKLIYNKAYKVELLFFISFLPNRQNNLQD